MKKVSVEHEKAYRVTSYFNDFEGDVAEWKNAWYELWRYQMTFNMAYEMHLRDSRRNGTFVDLLIKEAYIESLTETMDGLRYGKVRVSEELIGFIDDETADCYTWESMY